MNARTEPIAFPPIRWLLVPAAGVAIAVAVVERWRRRLHQPRVSPVSEHWLREEAARTADV